MLVLMGRDFFHPSEISREIVRCAELTWSAWIVLESRIVRRPAWCAPPLCGIPLEPTPRGKVRFFLMKGLTKAVKAARSVSAAARVACSAARVRAQGASRALPPLEPIPASQHWRASE